MGMPCDGRLVESICYTCSDNIKMHTEGDDSRPRACVGVHKIARSMATAFPSRVWSLSG